MAAARLLRAAGVATKEVVHVCAWLRGVEASEAEQLSISEHIAAALNGDDQYSRAAPWLRSRLRLAAPQPPPSPEQAGCHDVMPQLTARAWWEPAAAGVDAERAAAAARQALAELGELRAAGCSGFQPYRNPAEIAAAGCAADSLGAVATSLQLHGADAPGAHTLPRTAEMVSRARRDGGVAARPFGHALISALSPAGNIVPHRGPTNKKLRLYVPLDGPRSGGCWLEVGGERRAVEPLSPLVFDDSFLHSAANPDPQISRLVLIVDLWHPDLSDAEVSLLALMQDLHERLLQRQAAAAADSGDPSLEGNPYATIRAAGRSAAPPEQVFAGLR
eukprot:TRINITY_DN9627_c0_g1_i1.p1 TRINITY_DN9627_c0_g1~~TRINITY_DN9627_c0_g1_i1.p1  ORF type:complete len:333 (+),score=90.98 TRINITY_DN9627_c0_g1_i1:64-1062(+)